MELFKRLTKVREDITNALSSSSSAGATLEEESNYVPEVEEIPLPPLPPPPEVHIALPQTFTVDQLLRLLVEKGGSDLHLSVGAPPTFRVHGTLHFSHADALSEELARAILIPMIPKGDLENFNRSGNYDFAYEIASVARFRGNIFRQNHGMAAVFRVIPSHVKTIEELHLPGIVKRIALTPSGLVVVTGPTGSGKSTTLAAMINHINQNKQGHIITIEDPIEFVHPCQQCIIDHREVGYHATSFADALRASLREDPDIVLVGEMRDKETIYNAVKAAETGALVFGTLHTNSASKTVERIIDVFPPQQQPQIRAMLAESLRAVVAQLLLPSMTGGRVAVHEILIAEAGFSNIIREGKVSQVANYISMGQKSGMQTIDMGLLDLLKRQLIHPVTAADFCIDPTFFRPHGYNLEALRA